MESRKAPDWAERVAARSVAMDTSSRKAKNRSVGVTLAHEQNKAIIDAARARNISSSAYMRRAALAMACYDLGLSWWDLTEGDALLRTNGAHNHKSFLPDSAGGHGAGAWNIREVESYD